MARSLDVILRLSIVLLSLAGLADALYFTFAYYGRIRKARWVPEILCAREGSNCVTVVRTPYGRVFGLPNSVLGIVYYVLLVVWIVFVPHHLTVLGHALRPFETLGLVLLGASLCTVVLGFYLIYALRRILYTDCPLCYAAHAINIALFVLLILVS
ncbi:MAG TPA: vitamin K epoxide reductase family protein [Terriglobia bacterium]|nr:vitamin K epoxide reductase family protein [Terriglobia bacterium]